MNGNICKKLLQGKGQRCCGMTVKPEKRDKFSLINISRLSRKNAVNKSKTEDLAKAFKQFG